MVNNKYGMTECKFVSTPSDGTVLQKGEQEETK